MITFEPVRRALADRLPLGRPAARAAAGRADSARRSFRRCGVLGGAIVLVPLVGYLGTAVLMAIVIGTAEAARFSLGAALAAALPGWLALHQVPLSISDAPLSVFPLVPTGLVVLLIAAASSRTADRSGLTRPDQARWVVLSMALAHGLVGLVLALCLQDVVAADPVRAFLYCGLTALVAATLGVADRCGLNRLMRAQIGIELWAGARIGASAVAGAVVIGACLVLLSLLASLPELGGILAAADSPGDAFGLLLLSLLYLPNAVLAAWSFAAGSGLSIGAVELGPFGMVSGDLPAVPLFAALPSGSGAWWWALVLVLPPLLGIRVGRSCWRVSADPRRTWWVLAVAVGIAAPGVGLLAGLAGGRLGGALFDPVTLEPGLLTATTFGWIALPAAVALRWLTGRAELLGSRAAEDGADSSDGERSEPEALASEEDTAVAEVGDSVEDSDAPRGDDAREAPAVDEETPDDSETADDLETEDNPDADHDLDDDHVETDPAGAGTGGPAVEDAAPAETATGDEFVQDSAGGGTDERDGGNADDDVAGSSGGTDGQG